MDAPAQLDALIDVLGRLGITVRREHLGGTAGGFCEVRGRRVAFIDLDADAATQVEQCVRALPGISELEAIYVPPLLREMIAQRRVSE